MYGWQTSEVMGWPVREIIRSELSQEQRERAIHTLQTAGRYRIELLTHHKNGTPILTEGVTAALNDTKGKIIVTQATGSPLGSAQWSRLFNSWKTV